MRVLASPNFSLSHVRSGVMGSRLVVIEGRTVRYFTAGERLSAAERKAVAFDVFDVCEDRELERHSRLRRVLTTLVRPLPMFYGVLHWSDASDLEKLDRKIIEGEVCDADFAGALLAQPHTIVCRTCKAQLRVLAIDGGQALFAKTLAQRLQAHDLKSNCPICQSHLGMPIVEFLGRHP
ncbi:MAG: hypothetical protein ACRDPW_00465 [Mycobacteriales bacterium]